MVRPRLAAEKHSPAKNRSFSTLNTTGAIVNAENASTGSANPALVVSACPQEIVQWLDAFLEGEGANLSWQLLEVPGAIYELGILVQNPEIFHIPVPQ